MKLEEWVSGTGQKLKVHSIDMCKGRFCAIHNPSDHCMKDYPTHWRDDRGIMERICPHGIGHPDQDNVALMESLYGEDEYSSVHGCDGCCTKDKLEEK